MDNCRKAVCSFVRSNTTFVGIKGRRWKENYPSKTSTCFNEAWVYPGENETPQNTGAVEKGCYWK